MAIKNFSRFFIFSLTSFVFLLSACQTGLKTRQEGEQSPTRPSAHTPAPPTAGQTPGQVPGQTTGQTPTPVPGSGGFLQKETPKVGLILGPGGMKAFAHVGVLKEFAKARIPVTAITGLEWGAVFAGAFALQGQANEVEWKALRLREQDVPGKGFLSNKTKPETVSIMNEYLATAFGGNAIEKTKIPFSCPTTTLTADHPQWLARGSLQDAMKKCVPYPPYFLANGGQIAAPFAVDEAAQFLRSKGANLIILVNVASSITSDDYAAEVLWSEIRKQMDAVAAQNSALVNLVITVPSNDKELMDFAQRRSFIEAGAKAGREAVVKLTSRYGF
jgi:NTE family protein